MADTWDCEAYGPEATAAGALCFRSSDLNKRVCGSPDECHEQMGSERQRLFQRIQELAATDAPGGDFAYLAEVFTSPDQLLGGAESGDDDGEVPGE